jgi:sugar phosphate permease
LFELETASRHHHKTELSSKGGELFFGVLYSIRLLMRRKKWTILSKSAMLGGTSTRPHAGATRNNGEILKKGMEKRNGIFYGWVVLTIAFLSLVLGYAIRNTFSVFYPTIVEEFGWPRGNTALMFSVSIIVYGLAAPVAGSLVDRFGPRLILPVGSFIVGGSVALCGTATSPWHFYLFFGVMVAAGLSLIGWTPFTAILSNWFVKKRGLVFGILAAGFGGSLVFASVAQYLISAFGWQAAYVIIGVSSIAIIAPLCGFLMFGRPQDKGLRPDGLAPPLQEPRASGPPEASGRREATWVAAWTLRRAMKTYHFWLLFLIAFCLLGLVETIAIAHQVFFFRDVGYTPMLAANIYSVFGIAFVLGTLCSFISDRLGRDKVFIPSCFISAVAVCLLFLIKDASQPWMAFLFAVLFGLGIGVAAPVFFTTVADLFQGRHFGSIQGTVVLGFSLGGAVAPWLAGFIHDRTGSYFPTFLLLLISLLMCMLLMWLVFALRIRPMPSGS